MKRISSLVSATPLVLLLSCLAFVFLQGNTPSKPVVEFSRQGESKNFDLRQEEDELKVLWPLGEGQKGQLRLSLSDAEELIKEIAIEAKTGKKSILRNSTPLWQMQVGERERNENGAYTFFDRVDERGYEDFPLNLEIESVAVDIQETRLEVHISRLSGQDFSGELRLTLFAHSPLVQFEAIVSTDEEDRAILYRSGMRTEPSQVQLLSYHVAVLKGTDVDQPRNLAKSVTVE